MHALRTRPLAALALVVATLAAACSAGPQTVPIPTPSVTSVPAPVASAESSASARANAEALQGFYDQQVTWRNCGEAQCTKVRVPVDYVDASGPTIDLAVTRMKATGDTRLGSLFVNPGGPGGSAFDYAKAADYLVDKGVRETYDIIGVDPRGVGKSAPVECLTDAERDAILELDGTPDTPVEESALVSESAVIAEGCAEHAADLAPHVGTVNVARDMDVVREVVGDPVFNYLGKSYGTSIGAVYASLFPDRVGRMVLDGMLPPDLTLEQISLGQAISMEDAFEDFARDCARHGDCPFAGDAVAVQQQLVDFLAGLDAAPMVSKGRSMNEAVATYTVMSYLYFPPGDYAQLREALGKLVKDDDAGPMFDLLDARISRGPDGRYLDNSTDAFYAVTCADSPGQVSLDRVRALASEWAGKAPLLGASMAWGLLVCNDWPKVDAPVTAPPTTTSPILVVSTKHDPATPYDWGRAFAERVPSAGLLSWNAHQHTAYQQGSSCIDDYVDDYLLRGDLPPKGTLCD